MYMSVILSEYESGIELIAHGAEAENKGMVRSISYALLDWPLHLTSLPFSMRAQRAVL